MPFFLSLTATPLHTSTVAQALQDSNRRLKENISQLERCNQNLEALVQEVGLPPQPMCKQGFAHNALDAIWSLPEQTLSPLFWTPFGPMDLFWTLYGPYFVHAEPGFDSAASKHLPYASPGSYPAHKTNTFIP